MKTNINTFQSIDFFYISKAYLYFSIPYYMKFLQHVYFAILRFAYFATHKLSDFAKICILSHFYSFFLSETIIFLAMSSKKSLN